MPEILLLIQNLTTKLRLKIADLWPSDRFVYYFFVCLKFRNIDLMSILKGYNNNVNVFLDIVNIFLVFSVN